MIALRRSYVAYAVLAAAVVLAFGSAVTASFHFDDYALLTDPAVTSPSGWWEVWRPMQTRPLTYFTFWLNYAVGGRNPASYHLFNLLIHLASVLLLYGILSKLVPRRPAFIAAALFAIHPIQTEAVVYVYARGTLLMTLFCLLSLGSWIKGRQWVAAGWFAMALLGKEECVAFPLALFLLHLAASRNAREYKAIAAMIALSLAAGLRVIFVAASVAGSGAGLGAAISPMEYLATQGWVMLRYFRLLLVPYGFTVDPEIRVPGGWAAVLAWVAILVAAWLASRRFRGARAGFWFLAGLVLLLPSSSIFPANDLAADRRVYLPLIAFSAVVGLLLQRVPRRALTAAGIVLLMVALGRVHVWQTEKALWEEAVSRSPGKVRPKLQLARVVEPERALLLLRQARAMAPGDARVASELGRVYMARGQTGDALAEFGRALAIAPRDPLAYNNRGVALLSLGQRQAARRDFQRALQLDPCLFDARHNLEEMGIASKPPPGCRFTAEQSRVLGGGRSESP